MRLSRLNLYSHKKRPYSKNYLDMVLYADLLLFTMFSVVPRKKHNTGFIVYDPFFGH